MATKLIRYVAEIKGAPKVISEMKKMRDTNTGLGKANEYVTRTTKVNDNQMMTTTGRYDKFGKRIKYVKTEITSVNKSMFSGKNITDQYQKALARVAVVVPIWQAFRMIMQGVMETIKDLGKAYADFVKEMSRVATVTKSVGTSQEEFIELQKSAIAFTEKSTVTLKDSATAMYQIATAGLSASETLAGFEHILNTSVGTMTDITTTGKLMAGAFKLFGESLDDSLTISTKFQTIADSLAYTFSTQQVELSEIATAFGYAATAANSIDFEMKELIGTIGFLNTGLLKGSKAGTSLTNAIIKASSNLEKLEIITGTAFDPTKPLNFKKVMEALNKRFGEGKLNIEESAEAHDLFGRRGVRAILQIMQRWGDWNEAIDLSAEKIEGMAEKNRELMEENIPKQLEKLTNKWRASWIKMADVTDDGLLKMLKNINTFLEQDAVTKLTLLFAKLTGAKIDLDLTKSKSQTGLDLEAEKKKKFQEEEEETERTRIKNLKTLKQHLAEMKALGASSLQIATEKVRYMKEELGWSEKMQVVQKAINDEEVKRLAVLGKQAKIIQGIVKTSLVEAMKEGDFTGAFDSFKEGLRNAFFEAAAEGLTNQIMNLTQLDVILGKGLETIQIERAFDDGTMKLVTELDAVFDRGAAKLGRTGVGGKVPSGGVPSIAPTGTTPTDAGGMENWFGAGGNFWKLAGMGLMGASLFGQGGRKSTMGQRYSTAPGARTTAATTRSTVKAVVTNITVAPVFQLDGISIESQNLVKEVEGKLTPLIKDITTRILEDENMSGNT